MFERLLVFKVLLCQRKLITPSTNIDVQHNGTASFLSFFLFVWVFFVLFQCFMTKITLQMIWNFCYIHSEAFIYIIQCICHLHLHTYLDSVMKTSHTEVNYQLFFIKTVVINLYHTQNLVHVTSFTIGLSIEQGLFTLPVCVSGLNHLKTTKKKNSF